ncbi:DUF6252 family protein [Hymenobacter sp. ASUV-10]|uniref:DUF6252 family protein n=1 Tax=Hymenobacter aranciens TaxID=3063996 RepID=A0ABT9BGU1_9BACT|nr:DUF6252 family protein [Hymenobacter sp. ASUV-10]MDO7877485.1 DUF6252 family protein [Hymenobacter sp. ASUV-10]
MASRLLSFRAVATALAMTALFSSCSDDSDDQPATPAVGVSWTVDGNNVTASQVQKTVGTTEVSISAAAGSATSASGITLTVPKAVGTYTISATSAADATYTTATSGSAGLYGATSGTIAVTSLTATNIIGTYSFTGTDAIGGTATKTISNGKFNVAL